jgi:DNA (cytosine-5)-methyltransferase 1
MRTDISAENRDVVFEHICRDVRADDMEAFRLLGEGQTYIDLPERLRRYRSDVFTDKYKRLSWSELCRTITAHIAKDGYWYIHPDQQRTLSLREAARVQSFPDHFRFAGTQTHRYRQVGNAVPVLLGEVIGRAVKEALEQPRQVRSPERERFRKLLIGWRRRSDTWSPSWRADGGDPWLVLAAELVLARMRPTEAETTFEKLREMAPSPTVLLAHDEPERVLAEIGLTPERTGALLAVAEDLVTYFEGSVPNDENMLLLLPGVGEYTGRAALTFAFDRRQVLLDQTTARVAGRLARHSDTRRFQIRLDLHRLAGSAGPDAEFNRALLDLGRELCRPTEPLCEACPLRVGCATGRAGLGPLELSSAPDPTQEGLVAA